MSNKLTPEQRAKRWAFWTKTAAFIALGLIAAPVVGIAIYGLAGILVAGLIGLAGVTLGPVLGDMAGNWKLKLIKAEAARNPIETLQSEYMRRQELLDENEESISKLRSKTMTFADQVKGFSKQYPDEAPRYEQQLQAMRDLLAEHEQQWVNAQQDLRLFEQEIGKADAVWQMSLAANEAAEGTQLALEDFESKIKTQTSLGVVQNSLNDSFSRLEQVRLPVPAGRARHSNRYQQSRDHGARVARD